MAKIKQLKVPKEKKAKKKKMPKKKKASTGKTFLGNVKVKTKILSLALILMIVLVSVSAYNINGLNQIKSAIADINESVIPMSNEISNISLQQLDQTMIYKEVVIEQLNDNIQGVVRMETEFISAKLKVEEGFNSALSYAELGMNSSIPEVRDEMKVFHEHLLELQEKYLSIYALINDGIKQIKANDLTGFGKSATKIENKQNLFGQDLQGFNEHVTMFTSQTIVELQEKEEAIQQTTIYMVLIGLAIAMIPIIVIPGSITKPLAVIESNLKQVSDGDLTVCIDDVYLKRKDEIGVISVAVNNVILSVNELIKQIQTSSVTIVNSSENLSNIASDTTHSTNEIADAISDIAHGSSDQARQTEEGVQKIGALSTNIDEVENATMEMNQISEDTKTLNNRGMTCLSQLNDKTAESQSAFVNIEKSVLTVDSSMVKIEEITATIQSLSDQTNLLALNAAIEAARAGDAGRGFAVVADEVRKLAEQSSRSADNINDLINEIKNISKSAVDALNSSKITMNEQNEVVSDTNAIFEEIMTSINTLINMIGNIAGSIDHMSTMKDGIVETIHTISASAEEASASTEEISASTEEQLATMQEVTSFSETLNNLANELQVNINKFKV